MSRPWSCPVCGAAVFHWAKNGVNHGRATRKRVCSTCHVPKSGSNRGRDVCIRDGTSAWTTRGGKRACRECVRRWSQEQRRKNPQAHRDAVRRSALRRGLTRPREDDEADPELDVEAALDAALGRR